MNLTRERWPQGWIPSDNEYNGRPTGLLRMDNLRLDELGILALAKGVENVNNVDLGYTVTALYSKVINNQKHRFVSLSDASIGHVVGNGEFSTLFTGASATRATFGNGLGHVFIYSGNTRKKYNGTTLTDITPEKPSTYPTVAEAAKNDFIFVDSDFSTFTIPNGDGSNLDNLSDYCQFTTGASVGVLEYIPPSPWNSLNMAAGGQGTPEDMFNMYLRFSNPDLVTSVKIVFTLDSSFDPLRNAYSYEWFNYGDGNVFYAGTDAWSIFKVSRKDFVPQLTEQDKNWSSVGGLRIIVSTTGNVDVRVLGHNGIFFSGSNENPLNGIYEYMQVNVGDNGNYLAKSPRSDASPLVHLVNGRALVTPVPTVDSQVTECWIYRRDATYRSDVVPIGEQRKLDQWYRVKVSTDFAQFEDGVSDEDALLEKETYFEGLESIMLSPDEVKMCTNDLFNGRMFYITEKEVLVSEENDPGLYCPLWNMRLSGGNTELNLWIRTVSLNQILVGTTEDIYEISGTCALLPDGSLDIRITPLGISHPPIHETTAVRDGGVVYVAGDGIRLISGNSYSKISQDLDLLFQGNTCHEVLPILVQPANTGTYSLALAQDKLWFLAQLTDSSRRVFIYDFKLQYWRLWTQQPMYLFTEEDDLLLLGYSTDTPAHVRYLSTGTDTPFNGQDVEFRTIWDSNEQPRNRKDTFTLKVTADTGNDPVTIYLSKDGGGWNNLGSYQFNGKEEKLITINDYTLGFRYAIRVVGTSLTTFNFYNFTIEYDPRPEQLTYLRIPYTNQGTYARKRWTNFAFIIDTLGNNITFTPYIDGIADASSTVNLDRKGTHIHYFIDDTVGIDVGGILSGGTFEFYSLNNEETISEKLPTPVKYLLIPANDYGNPNRKRHSSYKFQINTRGADVRFTPRIDGVDKDPITVNTSEKRTVEYFFTVDTIGIDIGGTLESLADTPFEFYGVIVPQDIEVLPPRLKEFRIPENNYGIPAKKRVRTMPMVINTNGYDVTFTPIVDNLPGTPSTINTATKGTALHYFTTDVFGIDYSGELVGTQPFEFYGLLKPVDVEIIPTGKKFDQIGPVDLERIGRIIGFRVKLIATGTSLPYTIYSEDEVQYTGNIVTVPNENRIYEVMHFPKSLMGTVVRIELGPTDVFHRYWLEFKVNLSGLDTDSKVFKIQ